MLSRKLAPLILLPLILLFYTPIRAQNDDDKISIDSSIVVLNAYITDRSGNAVEGLDQKLF